MRWHTYHVKALPLPEVPGSWYRALKCRAKDGDNRPHVHNGLDAASQPFVLGGWGETSDEDCQREFREGETQDVEKYRRVETLCCRERSFALSSPYSTTLTFIVESQSLLDISLICFP